MGKKLRDEDLKLNVIVNGNSAKKELGDLEKSTRDLKTVNKELLVEKNKLKRAGKEEGDAYKKLTATMKANKEAIKSNDTKMAALRKTIGTTGLTVRQLAAEERKLKAEMLDFTPGTDEWKKYNKQLQIVKQRQAEVRAGSGKMQGAMSKTIGMVKKLLPAFGFTAIVGGLVRIGKAMISVRAQFEKYEAVLTNSFGDRSKALESMKMLQEFAAKTPFSLQELTGAYVKLTNYGLKPTREELQKMGDLASSVGKGFDQLAEAIADAVTGEFERLKEFGIKARKEGEKIKFTFKEQTTEIDNNSAAIKNYIQQLGELQGVAGAMEAISKTTGGAISNMGDAWDNMLNAMGQQTGGAVQHIIRKLTGGINRVTKQIDILNSSQLSFWQKWWGSTIGTNSVYDKMIKKQKESLRLAKERKTAEEELFNMLGHSSANDINPREFSSNTVETEANESLFAIQSKLLEQAKKLPETTEAEIIAKNKKIQVIEAEIKRLSELGELNEKDQQQLDKFLADVASKKASFDKYFAEAGEGAWEAFMVAFEKAQLQKNIDFSVVPESEEEQEEAFDPASSYELQQYQQTLDYKKVLLQAQLQHGLISQKQYQDESNKIVEDGLKKQQAKRQQFAESTMRIANFAADAVFSLMDMELEAAGDNEEKKKEIRKKYADIEFAVTTAQIAASTALGIMQAFAQLGPIAGAIAAAFIGATGLVQQVVAAKQRKKVKAMAKGKYPVAADDGNTYDANFAGSPTTGTYGNKPHLGIFNEVPGYPEMVVDGRTFKTMQMDYPGLISAIYNIRDGKQPGTYANGKYPDGGNQDYIDIQEIKGSGLKRQKATEKVLVELTEAVNQLRMHGTYTRLLGRDGFIETQNNYETMKNDVTLQ